MMTSPHELTHEELIRVVDRNRFSIHLLSERVGILTMENVELLAIVQELQHDLEVARHLLEAPLPDGATPVS